MYFDAHSDIWTDVTLRRLKGETDILRKYHVDRLRKGGIEGSIFVIWVDPPYDDNHAKRTKEIMECVKAEVGECDEIRIVHSYDEMMDAKRNGKIYVFHGIEGMAAIGEDLSKIDEYYEFGCRHGMLTWNEANALGAGASSGHITGLTALGKKAARIMQDKGMLLDVSHLNKAGFWDIAKLATKPIIASHSNCIALCDTPRNLTDEQLLAIRDLDGVVGLNSFNMFISLDRKQHTVETLARHAAHMIDVMGIEHVGCGFDFFEFVDADCMSAMDCNEDPWVKGLHDASEVPNLFRCFAGMGMTNEEMEKIAHLNFQRVIKKSIG